MKFPREVLNRLVVGWLDDGVDHYRRVADWLRDRSLDVWAREADAVADSSRALLLMHEDMTSEQVDAAIHEIPNGHRHSTRRRSATSSTTTTIGRTTNER